MNPIMQAHSGAAEQKDKQLSTITKKIMQNEERLSQVKASQETAAPLDRSTPWTRNYERWDMWEDADELQASLDKDKESQNSLLQSARSMTGCSSHDRSAEKRVYELPPADRLREMKSFREIGNAYYNEGQYARATMKYKRVQVFFEYFFEFDSPAQEEETNQVRLDSITNSAACFLKLNAYAETLEQCEQALKLDKDNVKTLYRQAVALRMRDQEGDLKLARTSLERAIVLDPDDLTLRKEMIKLRGKERSNFKNERAMAKRMVGGEGKDSNRSGQVDEKDKGDPEQSRFQQSESVLQLSFGDKKLELDDLFVPIVVDTSKAQETIDSLLGINLSDATTLRKLKHQEEKAKGGMTWAFRHPASCECAAPEIEFEDFSEDDEEADQAYIDDDEEVEEVTVEEKVSAETLDSVHSSTVLKTTQQQLSEPVTEKVEVKEVTAAEVENTTPKVEASPVTAETTTESKAGGERLDININMNAVAAVIVVLIGCAMKMNVHPLLIGGVGLGVGLIAEKQLTAHKN
mmetsp:Transcript_11421/g.20770  ORF Transcript_11421/g.20770 Transcript_11421/m.20770 type:complete len:520 (-) Transcript_11421:21-1580(-)